MQGRMRSIWVWATVWRLGSRSDVCGPPPGNGVCREEACAPPLAAPLDRVAMSLHRNYEVVVPLLRTERAAVVGHSTCPHSTVLEASRLWEHDFGSL
jgi:hypothetical protein